MHCVEGKVGLVRGSNGVIALRDDVDGRSEVPVPGTTRTFTHRNEGKSQNV